MGHALRAKYCTSISNTPNLNICEKLSATRHSTANALLPYVAQTTEGKTRKLKALVLMPPPNSSMEVVEKKIDLVYPTLKEEAKQEESSKKLKR